jgi:hypothetical protein
MLSAKQCLGSGFQTSFRWYSWQFMPIIQGIIVRVSSSGFLYPHFHIQMLLIHLLFDELQKGFGFIWFKIWMFIFVPSFYRISSSHYYFDLVPLFWHWGCITHWWLLSFFDQRYHNGATYFSADICHGTCHQLPRWATCSKIYRNWFVSNVMDMSSMCYIATSFLWQNVHDWNTSSVRNRDSAFVSAATFNSNL